jgi:hypothetical protein
VSVKAPERRGCISSLTVGVGARAAHALVKLRLSPGSGHSWCPGRFHGQVVQYQSVVCGPPQMVVCPLLVIAPQTIARFRFRVH